MPSTPSSSSILCIGRCCRSPSRQEKHEEAEEDTTWMEPKRRRKNNENPDPGYALASASEPTLLGEQSDISSSATAKLNIASASRRRMRHNNRHCRRFFVSREIFAVSACVFFSFLLFPFAVFANANTEEPPSSPFASMSNDFTRLKELSSNMNGLRGSSDAAAGLVPIFEEFKDILQNHIASMQSMEHMLEEGDIDGVVHAVHTLLSDSKLLSLVAQDTKDIEGGVGGVIKDMEGDGLSLDNIPDLVRGGDVPSASIVEFLRKEDFQDLTEHLINIARNLDSVDLSFLAGSNGRRLDEDLHRQREREPLTYDTDSEENKDYDFGEDYLNFFGPNHHGFKPSHQQFTKMSSTMGGKLKSVMKAARRKQRMPRLHKFFNHNGNDGRERRLRAETRVQRRRLALQNSGGSNQWCQEECPSDNTTCNCEKLFNCIKRMSVYDAAVLFADGYIVTDMNDENFGNFTTDDLNLYDVANGGLYEKFLEIQQYADGPANDEQCTNLLMEMHKACDSTSSATCSNVNSQSYQLTVDQVCDGVNTDTKLYFEAIFDAYSIKPGAQLSLSYSSSTSYDSCAEFVREFDRLYEFRNKTFFPHGNPMRVNSYQPLTSTENTILFEDTYFFTSYTFIQNQHGVETVNPIRPISTENVVLTPVTGGCPQIKDETTCLSSKDGREDFLNQPCRWCCGFKCTAEGGNLCEPENWLLEQPSYIGLSINLFGNGFCSRPATIYDGSSTSFDGRCIDAFGNYYRVDGSQSAEFYDSSVCLDYCQSLPNSEFLVGYFFRSSVNVCYCCRPDETDTYGNGPVMKGDSASDYECYLTPSYQEKSARGSMQLCDATMSLFLGNSVSVGRLRQIVNEIEENGSSYMPGECCLDTAATSARFGFNFDPSKMDCNNRGPWHLGISEEACENANGKWFRSPCYALKDCIDDRPRKCPTAHSQDDNNDCDDDAFSKSFEQFAEDIEIDDATDEEECGYAREQLGFDIHYMYDAEVCAEFRERMCDPFYDDVDDVTDQTIEYEAIGYNPPSYPPDPAFTYDELPAKPSAVIVTNDGGYISSVNALQTAEQSAWAAYQWASMLESQKATLDRTYCETFGSIGKIFCYIGIYVVFLVEKISRRFALVAWEALNQAYISMNQQKVNYPKINHEILQKDGNWTYEALNTMNANMVDINTQLQKHLQDRHFSMEVNINTYNMCSSNYLGINLIKAIEPDAIVSNLPPECQEILFPSNRRYLVEEFKLEVEWPDHGNGGHGMMTKLLTYMESMKEEIMQDKKKKAKCDKESLEERNLLAEDDNEGEADSLDLNEEASYDDILSIVEMVVKEQMDHITNVVDELKGSMEKLEALDVKETKLEKLETLEKKSEAVDTKLKTLEEKLEVADQKMDEMKNMIAQLLEQVAKQSSVTETDEK